MASPITFGGLASGLDTKSIIAALVGVEGQKVTLLQNEQSDDSDKISAYDTLLTRLNSLQDRLGTISDPNGFLAQKVTLSDGGSRYVTATTTNGASNGVYQLAVTALAQNTFARSNGFADPNAATGLTGNLSLRVGAKQTDVAIGPTNDTLYGIRDAINASGVAATATVVFDGTNYVLELRGDATGAANEVQIVAQPTPAQNGPSLGLAEIRGASDASFTVDNQPFTSASNTVTSAIQGVTLQLHEAQAVGAGPIQLTVDGNFDDVQQQLQSFVDSYNSVLAFVNAQQKARASTKDPVQPLSGESALFGIRSSFGSIVAHATNLGGAYDSLAAVGIHTQNDGTLTLDTTKLQSALAADANGVAALFTDATQGVGKKLLAAVQARTDPVDGIVKTREDSFHRSITALDDQIAQAQQRLDDYQQSLVLKFANLETLLSKLQQQGNSLAAISSTTTSTPNLGNLSHG